VNDQPRRDLYEFGGTEQVVRNYQKRFVQYFQRGSTVLDIGCGRGVFLELLRENGIYGVGLDASPEALATCGKKGISNVHLGDALTFLEDKASCYDGVFCSHVIEHLEFAQATRLLALCYQALTPGGTIIIITPNAADLYVLSTTFWLDPTHVRLYPLLLLVSMFKQAGYLVEDSGFVHAAGGSRRMLPRFYFLRLILGPYFGHENTFIVGAKPPRA